jgi:integrase
LQPRTSSWLGYAIPPNPNRGGILSIQDLGWLTIVLLQRLAAVRTDAEATTRRACRSCSHTVCSDNRPHHEWGELRSAPKIQKLPGERHREHVISFGEEAKYLANVGEPLGSVAAVLVDTGLRPEECFRLRWESITWLNGRHGTLLVTHGNTAAARRVLPMTPRVRKILENRWANSGKPLEGWIWPASTHSGHIEPSSLKKQHCKALKLSKVRTFVLYSLRHTFLTRLGVSGCDTWTLARIAGHSSIAISARYVHPSHDAVLCAIDKLGGHKIGHSEDQERFPDAPSKALPA